MKLPHMPHDGRGIECLSPFAFCEVLPDLGTDRLMDVFVEGCVPSDPWVPSGLLTSVSFIWIFLHQVPDEVFRRVGDVIPVGGVELIFCLEDLFEELGIIFIIKRRVATEQNIGNHSDGPAVNSLAVWFLGQDLGSNVARGPTGCGHHISFALHF